MSAVSDLDNAADLTDVGPATPAPSWCLPGAVGDWHRTPEGAMTCSWSRDVSVDVWIAADDHIIDGRVMRSGPRVCVEEQENLSQPEARRLAEALIAAADIVAAAG
jgi:hypothetical protein